MVAQLAGQQDKKKSLDKFYAQYDETFEEKDRIEESFRDTIDAINESFVDTLSETEFRRPPLFYTLFCTTYHRLFGLPGERLTTPKKGKLLKKEGNSLRDAAFHLSDKIMAYKQEEEIPRADIAFVNACLRQTDNIKPREIRLIRLYEEAFE